MRPRYLLVAGKTDPDRMAAIEDRLAATTMHHVVLGAAHLFVSPDAPLIPLPCSDGTVIGTLFDRATGRIVSRMAPADDHAVANSDGALLVDRYWGSYVAIWADPVLGVRIIRDPAGAVPALWYDDGTILLVTSDVGLAAQAGLMRLDIAWQDLARTLMLPELPGRRTALAGLNDTVPGTCHTPGRGRARDEIVWHPARFTRADAATLSASHHAERVRAAVLASAASWRACFETVALELSGGLDSSIVAAGLAATQRDWIAQTLVTPGRDGDERIYARAVARHLDAPLQEIDFGRETLHGALRYRRLTPSPRGTCFLGPLDQAMTRARDALGVEATFTGLGGDHIFFSTQSPAPVLDALTCLGLKAGCHVAMDMARLCGVPLTEVLHAAARRRWSSHRARRWQEDTRYLAPAKSRRPAVHPWLDLPQGTLHGTHARIGKLLRATGLLDGVDRMATRTTISPLLSQPVIEACLAVPSWQCVSGGRDRAVARMAFATDLPDIVIKREGKGRVDSLVVGRLERERPETRALLLEGLLAGAGLLDRSTLERDLARPGSDRDPFQDRLLLLIDAELWARAIASAGCGSPTPGK